MNNLKNNLVVQHNELIVASYEMTVHEQNVLLACISQLDSRPEAKPITDQDTYTITVEQARDLFYDKGDQRNAFRDLEFASRRLFERKVELDLGNNETLLTRFVQSIKFKPDSGCVELRFATEILPYLTQLHGNYTQYRMGQVVQLTSIHSRRLFELILMWSGQQQWQQELEVDEFRDLMNVYGKYKQFGELKKRVIDPAVAMVNENTDFHVSVGYRKVKRSFKFIQLKYHRRQPQEVPPTVDCNRDANTPDMLTSLKMTDKQRLVFAAKLSELPELGDSCPIGWDYKQYAAKIANELLDPEKQVFYQPYLTKIGFKS